MKAYRKKLIGLALAAVFSFSPVSVFASSVNITSGLQIGGDEVECTFDSSRILYEEQKAKPAARNRHMKDIDREQQNRYQIDK